MAGILCYLTWVFAWVSSSRANRGSWKWKSYTLLTLLHSIAHLTSPAAAARFSLPSYKFSFNFLRFVIPRRWVPGKLYNSKLEQVQARDEFFGGKFHQRLLGVWTVQISEYDVRCHLFRPASAIVAHCNELLDIRSIAAYCSARSWRRILLISGV